MKIQCNRAALHEAIQLASSIVPARTPKQILQCACLRAEEEGQVFEVLATDGDITLNYRVSQVQIEAQGSVVLPADRLAAILHESLDETLTLELKDSTCEVLGKGSRFHIYGFPPEDFPVVDIVEQDSPLLIQAAVLRRMIRMSTFAAAKEHSRYAINGVLWEQRGKKLRMVATDGRRMAQIDGNLAGSPGEQSCTAIVPAKAMLIAERILTDADEKVRISISENQIVLATARGRISANLVQGRFPKYSDVIPSGCDKMAQLDTEMVRSGVRRAALLTNEHSKGVLLAFSPGELCLTSSTPETGDAEVKIEARYEGAELKIGFNPQYILEALRVIEEPEVVLEFIDEAKPGLLRAGKDFLYVLMPVTV